MKQIMSFWDCMTESSWPACLTIKTYDETVVELVRYLASLKGVKTEVIQDASIADKFWLDKQSLLFSEPRLILITGNFNLLNRNLSAIQEYCASTQDKICMIGSQVEPWGWGSFLQYQAPAAFEWKKLLVALDLPCHGSLPLTQKAYELIDPIRMLSYGVTPVEHLSEVLEQGSPWSLFEQMMRHPRHQFQLSSDQFQQIGWCLETIHQSYEAHSSSTLQALRLPPIARVAQQRLRQDKSRAVQLLKIYQGFLGCMIEQHTKLAQRWLESWFYELTQGLDS